MGYQVERHPLGEDLGQVAGTVPIVKGVVLWSASRDIAPLVPGEAGMWGTMREGLVS